MVLWTYRLPSLPATSDKSYQHLSFLKVKDVELSPVVNRDLSRRVRPVAGAALAKQAIRHDIKLAARLIREFDKRAALYEKETKEETEAREKAEKEAAEVKAIYSLLDLLNLLAFLEILFICTVGTEHGASFPLSWLINVILCNTEFCFATHSQNMYL